MILKNLLSATFKNVSQLSILHLPQLPILQQLVFEESLYRLCQNTSNAWLIFNDFTYPVQNTLMECPQSCSQYNFFGGRQEGNAIVLGISGKPHELLVQPSIEHDAIPLIRRYTGGGTVVISPSVFMVTLILPRAYFGSNAFPKDVMAWTGSLYSRVFPSIKERKFRCRENDYTIETADGLEQRKIGGNAQAFGRRLIVHHTSFLWEADYMAMHRYLKPPKRQPNYRAQRTHEDFVCGINSSSGFPDIFENPQEITGSITREVVRECQEAGFRAETLCWNDICSEAESLVRNLNEISNLKTTCVVGFDGKPLQKRSDNLGELEQKLTRVDNLELKQSVPQRVLL